MKINLIHACFGIMTTFIVGCSSTSTMDVGSTRNLANSNAEYICKFQEVLGNEKTEFTFSPVALELSFKSDVIKLKEDDFVSGGFVYVQDEMPTLSEWKVDKVEFISYSKTPSITVSLKTVDALKTQVIKKDCI